MNGKEVSCHGNQWIMKTERPVLPDCDVCLFTANRACAHNRGMSARRAAPRAEADRSAALHIVTGCTTREQFVSVFRRFCEGKLCFVPTVETRAIGSSLPFSVQLADGTPMLQGTCVVRATWQNFEGPHNRPGIQLELKKMPPDSNALYRELIANRMDDDATRMIVATHKAPPAPPPIPVAARTPRSRPRVEQTPRATPLPVGMVPSGPLPSDDSVSTVVVTGQVPAEAMPSLDSMPTRVVEMFIPAEAMPEPPPRFTAATVPSRRSKATTDNPLADLEDSALDAFLESSISESSQVPPRERGTAKRKRS